MILVFGCRQPEMDHIYKEETIQAKNAGVFNELYTVYSREPGKPKVQAQHTPELIKNSQSFRIVFICCMGFTVSFYFMGFIMSCYILQLLIRSQKQQKKLIYFKLSPNFTSLPLCVIQLLFPVVLPSPKMFSNRM